MKPVVLNLSAVDFGGAGHFSRDFNSLLNSAGYKSYLIVKDKKSIDTSVIRYPDSISLQTVEKVQRKLAKLKQSNLRLDTNYSYFNLFEKYTTASAQKIISLLPLNPDIIFIHWVSDFINSKLIRELYEITNAKLIWLMLDNAPITGGCHYPWNCKGFESNCSNCPAILSKSYKRHSMNQLKLKADILPRELSIVSFSNSDYYRALYSRIGINRNVHRLLGFVDEDVFDVGNKYDSKMHFNISPNTKVLFFGASSISDKRKGFALLLKALKILKDSNVILLVAGSNVDLPTNIQYKIVGNLNQDDLVKAYQAADIFICPSIEDSGPMMINQSLMCGTPVVAFNIGVAQDLIINGQTGYKARLGDVNDLVLGINSILQLDVYSYKILQEQCRTFAINKFSKNIYIENLRSVLQYRHKMVTK